MKEFVNQGLFYMIIQIIICLCVFALFLSIFIDFALFSRSDKVQNEKKSIVETGTMTVFFIVFYFILRSGIGVIALKRGFFSNFIILTGATVILFGCLMNITGRFNLGKNWANQIKIFKEHTLVQSGMYRVVRHPLYASIILMFFGACIVYRNIVSFSAVTIIFIPFMYYRAKQEEILLVNKFPNYIEYRNKTGMFFPKIHKGKEWFH